MAGDGDTDLSRQYSPAVRLHSVDPAIPDQKALYFTLLDDVRALSIGGARVPPRHRIVTGGAGAPLQEVRELKRSYVDLLLGLVADVESGDGGPAPRVNRHVAVYTLFGMMNWIYTWYDPKGSVGVEELAESICRLFLYGYAAEVHVR